MDPFFIRKIVKNYQNCQINQGELTQRGKKIMDHKFYLHTANLRSAKKVCRGRIQYLWSTNSFFDPQFLSSYAA
jgi:hypothetical protein